MGITADKIAKHIKACDQSGVVDLAEFRAARRTLRAAHLDGDRIGRLIAQGHDPYHAVYICGQNSPRSSPSRFPR